MREDFSEVWRSLDQTVVSGRIPGLVAGIRHHGFTEYHCAGVKTLGEPAPMSTETPFRIASLSKLVAGALAVSMIADGSISPDDPVDLWLPELAFPKVLRTPESELNDTVHDDHEITVRHLLTLTHGMGVGFTDSPLNRAMKDAQLVPGASQHTLTADEYMARIGQLPLAWQPGTRWAYHVGSDILSVLLARAAQMQLSQLVEERITGPLGMESTRFWATPGSLPTAYQDAGNGLEVFDTPNGMYSREPAFQSLGGGLVSTVPDYMKFMAALADDTLLPADLRATMTSDQLTGEQKQGTKELMAPGESWGWQVCVNTKETKSEGVGTFGWAGGTGTMSFADPSRDVVAVLFTQRLMGGPQDGFDYFTEPLAKLTGPTTSPS